VLLLDQSDAPLGWIKASELISDGTLTAEFVDASSPLVHLETTLRDTLAMLLTSAVQTAVVVDEHESFSGMLTFDELGHAFRTDPEPEAAVVS
jgi:CBS domain containing-hemolysin-like protein